LSQHYNFDGDLAYSDVVNSFTSITYNVTAGLTFRFGEY
jgi:OOP family OmpA-OmpF porin